VLIFFYHCHFFFAFLLISFFLDRAIFISKSFNSFSMGLIRLVGCPEAKNSSMLSLEERYSSIADQFEAPGWTGRARLYFRVRIVSLGNLLQVIAMLKAYAGGAS